MFPQKMFRETDRYCQNVAERMFGVVVRRSDLKSDHGPNAIGTYGE